MIYKAMPFASKASLQIRIVFVIAMSLLGSYCLFAQAARSEDNKSSFLTADSLCKAGLINYWQNRYPKAILNFQKSIDIVLHEAGAANLDELNTLVIQKLSLENQVLLHTSLNRLGVVQRVKGNTFSAIDIHLKASRFAAILPPPDSKELAAKINSNLSLDYLRNGELQLAKYHGDLALQNWKELQNQYPGIVPATKKRISQVYNNNGLILSQSNFWRDALGAFGKSLSIKAELPKQGGARGRAINFNNIGEVYFKMGVCDSALFWFRKANSIRETNGISNHLEYALTQINIGRGLACEGNYHDARFMFASSLQQMESLLGDRHPELARALQNLAATFSEHGRPVQALKILKKAKMTLSYHVPGRALPIALSSKGVSSAMPQWIVPLISKTDMVSIFRQEAAVNEQIAAIPQTTRKNQVRLLKGILAKCDSANQILDVLRDDYITAEDQRRVGLEGKQLINIGLRSAYKLFQLLGNNAYMSIAFELMEKSKANTILKAIRESGARNYGDISKALTEEETAIKVDLAYYRNRLFDITRYQKSAPDTLQQEEMECRSAIVKGFQAYGNVKNKIKTSHQNYFDLKYNLSRVSLDTLQQVLVDKKINLVNYFWGDEHLFVFLVNAQGRHFFQLPLPTTEAILNFRKSIIFADNDYLPIGSQLFDKLLKPVLPYFVGNQLLIIPDGLLHLLPFEALIENTSAQSEDRNQLTFVIEKYVIGYNYSATLFVEQLEKNRVYTDRSFLGIAPVLFHNNRQLQLTSFAPQASLPDLPHSKQEVMAIANIFNEFGLQNTTLIEEEASKTKFLSEAIRHNIVHIASHVILNAPESQFSRMFLWKENDLSTTQDNGYLSLRDIFNLRLNADLAVLNGCDSGLGDNIDGEGVIGFGRGLFYAGSNNLLLTLWKIDDQASAVLTTKFYSEVLNNNKPYPLALQTAKLFLLRGEGYSHPRFWASTIFLGNNFY
ncbi:MAG: CHAT domain-containing protein [Calditrichia bacterium]